ncbi:MAG: hypothetical protein WC869_01315 [Phycisphaerae bacterium]|jgi:hypothetical protein
MILPFSDETPQLTLVPVEAHGGTRFKDWYELQLGNLVICHIQCWSDDDESVVWELRYPGPDSFIVADSPGCTDPVSAAHWFFLNKIKGL